MATSIGRGKAETVPTVCMLRGDGGESYAMHLREFTPASANQVSFGQQGLAVIGHWPGASRIPGRNDRSVRTHELHLRRAIARKLASGRGAFLEYHIPTAVAGRVGAGASRRGNAST